MSLAKESQAQNNKRVSQIHHQASVEVIPMSQTIQVAGKRQKWNKMKSTNLGATKSSEIIEEERKGTYLLSNDRRFEIKD